MVEEYKAVKSSMILGVAYNKDTQLLKIEFSGGARYQYSGVDEDTYDELMSAPSVGSYFHDNIKDNYPCARV